MGPSGSDGSLGGTLQNTRNGAVAVVLVVVVVVVVAVVAAVVAAVVVVVVVVAIPTSVLFGLGFQVRGFEEAFIMFHEGFRLQRSWEDVCSLSKPSRMWVVSTLGSLSGYP